MRVKKNELFGVIMSHGISPDEFELESASGAFTNVRHGPSGSTYRVYDSGREVYSGNSTVGHSAERSSGFGPWASLLEDFSLWLQDVELEVDTPDAWEEFRRGNYFINNALPRDLANAPFTVTEQTDIAEQLRVISKYVKKTYSLTRDQAAQVKERFDEAERASRYMGRKDWLVLFAGTLFSLIVSDVVTPHVVQHILTMTAQGLGQMFGVGTPRQIAP